MILQLLPASLPFAQVSDLAVGLDQIIEVVRRSCPPGTFFSYAYNIRALIALVLVSLVCGAVGSLVVGGRLAFFSDALAHCAFAGVSIGFLLFTALVTQRRSESEFWQWVLPVMVLFGALVGFGIAFVRSQTGLANDTVIGVFFAGAIGLAAMLNKLIRSRALFNMESFLFGDPGQVKTRELILLVGLAVVTACTLAAIYNTLLLSGFNPSLARSRGLRVRLAQYAFVVLLALIVNMCLLWVGVLLINALLVVPAAAVANISRNLRQMFWFTLALCFGVSLTGLFLSWEVAIWTWNPIQRKGDIELGISGTIVLLSVLAFIASMLFSRLELRSRPRTTS
jgi:zinc transport system permease protein